MNTAMRWTLGAVGSMAAHGALAGVLLLSVNPEEVAPQRPAETQMSLTSYPVPQSDARAQNTGGETASEAEATAAAAQPGVVPLSQGVALPLTGEAVLAPDVVAATALENLAAPGDVTVASGVTGAFLNSAALPATPTRPSDSATQTLTTVIQPSLAPLTSATLPTTLTTGISAESQALSAVATDSTVAAAAEPLSSVAAAAPLAAAIVQPSASATPSVAAADIGGGLAAQSEIQGTPAAATAPNSEPAPDLPPPATFATAALAWSGGDQTPLDPTSLAAIEAFMQPGDASVAAQEARDGISGLLAAVPCARLQTEFNPATGALELRGHIPEEGMRGPVLAALQGEVGASLPVADNLLILPRPQCGALAGIAEVGLPQSTDQLTNPRILGNDAHAREFRFAAGDTFVLEMVAPEYPAVVYVDYFDADGNVLHLTPNDFVLLEEYTPDQAFPVAEALNITIGPPYGQEIAVAFAASKPLYEGLRPLQEPAADYLVWLKEQVARARAEDPSFKGEWVYFFVTTRQTR